MERLKTFSSISKDSTRTINPIANPKQTLTLILKPNPKPPILQEAQLMMRNSHDTFRGQSRSPNTVPFHMLGIFHLVQ